MNSGGGGAVGAATSGGTRSPFTVCQWQELEHQALIFKYMMAGLPVPPDLVLPIQRSFGSVSHRFPHYSPLGYCSFYGKKVDPEPGRCRRTDGKKWRCSKDAYPDSKYCERHMHRGRNRSRKPVESQTSSSTTVTTGSNCGTGSFPNLSFGNYQSTGSVTNQPKYMDSIPYGIPSKDYRYLKPAEMGEHNYFSGASGSNKGLQPLDSACPLMPTSVSSYPQSKSSQNSIMQNDYPNGLYFSSGFASGEVAKQEDQSLRPFFQEWPKARESWAGLEDERSVSTTQLSISVPMASSVFSATSSQSPHDN